MPQEYAHQEVRHDGFTTKYLTAGDPSSPAILLVHDGWFGADAESLWSNVVPMLSESYYILAPDMVGFGGSTKAVYFDVPMYVYRARHLNSFIESVMGAGRFVHGVGTSLGGSVLLRSLSDDVPSIPLASVVSISGSGGPGRSEYGAKELARFDGTRDDIVRMLGHMADDFKGRDSFIDHRYRNLYVPGHIESMLAGGVKRPASLASESSVSGSKWPEALASVNVPVTLVGCHSDPLLDAGWENLFADVSSLVRTVSLNARHAPSLDHPSEVADLVHMQVDASRKEVGR